MMNRKKWLCVLLSLTMAFSLMPTAAFAAETETGQDSTAAAAESVQEAEEPPADKQEEAAPVETPAREQEDEDTEAAPAQAEEEAALPAAEEPTGPADRDPAVPATEPEEAGETEEAGEADTEAAALAEGDDTASEADRTVLQETISRAQALVQEDYTEESWKVFADALAAAQTTAEKAEAAQEEIDAAANALEQAMADLKEENLKGSGYVLMNIPYGKFYESEGCGGVDAVSSATKSKPRNGGLTAGSYHVSSGGDDISGIIYPVYVEDLSVLKDNRRITDRDSITITTTARGRTSTATYNGREALFESESYSFYLLGKDSQPAGYKKLSGSNGSYSFGASTGSVSSSEGVTGSVSLNARHTDVEIQLSVLQVGAGESVSGVILTTEDGSRYPLRHLTNLWRSTEIGWNYDDSGFEDLAGKTITNIRYYMPDGTITDYPVQIDTSVEVYALMNIPYDDFYAAEGGSDIDAVSSATKVKSTDPARVGGSYHENSDGSDISGGTYPVKITSAKVLADQTAVSVPRGTEDADAYVKETLFSSPGYTYYVLAEQPAHYKELTVNEDGSYSFGEAVGEVKSVEGADGTPVVGSRHDDIEMKLSGVTANENVAGVVVTTQDGSRYCLRHEANLWKGTQIGWNYDDAGFEDLFGKTITNLRYFHNDGAIVDYPCSIELTAYVLMNIPYAQFYAAEGDSEVDAVSSATKSKPRSALAAGSYHVSSDGNDISGIIYPVKVSDTACLKGHQTANKNSTLSITVRLRGQEVTTDYTGSACLFEMPDYSYFGLDSEPVSYKEMTAGGDGSYSFGPATGPVTTVEGAEGAVTLNARHADTEIVLSGLQVEAGAPVSGVVLTTEDGSQYGLRHVVNLWRSTQVGWNNSDSGFEDIGRKTITNVRYYMPDGTITDYPVRIALAVGQYNELVDDHRIIRDDNDTEELFAAYLAAVNQVVVNGTAYDAAGDNAVRILDPATGELLLNAADRQAFPGLAENEVTLKADGYPDYSFRLVQPEITAGMHGQWTKGSKETLSFTSNAKFDYLREVRVDDAAIDPAHYTAAEGSTVIDLTPEYLETLAAGAHTIGIVSANGIASTDFTIVPAEEEEPAEDQKKEEQTSDPEKDDTDSKSGTSVSTKDSKGSGSSETSGRRSSARSGRSSGSSHTGSAKARTGDTANTGLWLLLICAAGAGMAVLLLRRRDRKN